MRLFGPEAKGELFAYARQAGLIGRSLLEAATRPDSATRPQTFTPENVPAGESSARDVVVLLHGLMATAAVLGPLRERLERSAGARTSSLTYGPGLAFDGIERRLRSLLAAEPRSARIHLVGHSLGGIVARYVAVVEGDPRIVQTISIAAPFGGIAGARFLSARFLSGAGGLSALEPDGPVLTRIRRASWSGGDPSGAGSIPHLSIVAEADTVVRPPLAHALPGGDVRVLRGLGHNGVLFDDEAHRLVVSRVLAP